MWPAGEAALPPDVQHKRSYLSVSCRARLCSEQSRALWDTAALLFPGTMAHNSFIKAERCLEPAFWHYALLEDTELHPCLTRIPGGVGGITGKSGGTVQGEQLKGPWANTHFLTAQVSSLMTIPAVPLRQAFFSPKTLLKRWWSFFSLLKGPNKTHIK